MLGVTLRDCIRNEAIRRRTKVTDIALRIAKLKWQWEGHYHVEPMGRKGSRVAITFGKVRRRLATRWTLLSKCRGSPLDAGGSEPVTLALFGGGLCPAVDVFRLI
jgi:hypothetical protein